MGVRRDCAFALVILALLVRILVPAGWMPSADGSRTITLCTGMGVQQISIAADGSLHDKAPAAPQRDHPCAFAGIATPLDLAVDPATALIGALPVAAIQPVLIGIVAVGRGLAAPPPPQTGPPHLRS